MKQGKKTTVNNVMRWCGVSKYLDLHTKKNSINEF